MLESVMEAPKTPLSEMPEEEKNAKDACEEEKNAKDVCKHYKRAFLEYLQVCAKRSVVHGNLDECLVGWGRWCIKTEEMFTSEEAREVC